VASSLVLGRILPVMMSLRRNSGVDAWGTAVTLGVALTVGVGFWNEVVVDDARFGKEVVVESIGAGFRTEVVEVLFWVRSVVWP
jgi:hypothetical protein